MREFRWYSGNNSRGWSTGVEYTKCDKNPIVGVFRISWSEIVCPVLSSCCPTVLCLFLKSILSLACRKERVEFDWREGRSTRNNYLSQYRSLSAEKDKENKLVKWENIFWFGQKRIKSGGCKKSRQKEKGI